MSGVYPASPFGEGGSRRWGDLDTSPDTVRNTQTQAAELAELRRGERATWGPRLSNATWSEERPNRHPLSKLKRWVPHHSRSMLGFFSVQLASGLILNDCRLMRGGEAGFWIAMPSRQLFDPDGNPRFDDKGRPIYTNLGGIRGQGDAEPLRRGHPRADPPRASRSVRRRMSHGPKRSRRIHPRRAPRRRLLRRNRRGPLPEERSAGGRRPKGIGRGHAATSQRRMSPGGTPAIDKQNDETRREGMATDLRFGGFSPQGRGGICA